MDSTVKIGMMFNESNAYRCMRLRLHGGNNVVAVQK